MKGKILTISICMLLIATTVPAIVTIEHKMETNSLQQDFVEWEYTYGGDEFDWLYCIENCSDGGYIATGLTEEDNMYYAWLLKVDKDGNEQWSAINYGFNGTSIENEILVQCVRETPDNGYIVGGIGTFYSTIHSVWTAAGYLWKVDATGSTEWLMPLGNETEMWYLVPFVFENFDGTGWMCAGFYLGITSPTDYYLDVALFKTDFDGNLLWYQSYDLGNDWEFARSLWKTTDNGYYLSGTSLVHPSSSNGGFFMIKTSSDGTLTWSKIFDGPGYDYSAAMGCRQTSDNGYIMSGLTNSYGAGGTDLWVIKTDENGDIDWNKTYGEPSYERNYGMDETVDGNYAFICIADALGVTGTKEDTWILTTDKIGNPEWEVLIEKDGTQWSQSIVQTIDKGFIISGRTGAMGNPNSDGMILKVSAFPQLDITISGGFGVSTTITNNGDGDALDVPWEITITGGILGMINHTINGTTDILSGASETLKSGLFFGFGSIQITVKVGPKEVTKEGFQLLFLTL